MTTSKRDVEAGARLSIGALSRATGVPVETLRTWEARYGFPVPERRPSGHRVYTVGSVLRLRRIAEALARGHRAGNVVSASERDLSALLDATGGPNAEGRAPLAASPLGIEDLVRLVAAFDADRLSRVLLADWGRLGPLEFLEHRVAPLIRAVGDGWEAGRLEIRHEHFLSERVGDILRSLRLPYEERAAGPLVAVATLPGEAHGLGLQMAALTLATSGWRILFLGTEVPLSQIAAVARDVSARAVAVSVSIANRGKATNTHLRRLRSLLPRRVALLVGGEGAPRVRAGLEVFSDLRGLDTWGRRVAGSSRPA